MGVVKQHINPMDYREEMISYQYNPADLINLLPFAIVDLIASKIADKFVEEHYAELAAKLDQQAIANLAIADSGKKIAEEIRTKPTVLHDGCKTTVNRYSIF